MNHDPDHLLIKSIAGGDTDALNRLYDRYGSGIMSFLYTRLNDRQLAEEVLQDVMLAVWKSAGNFRGESKVLTWLLTIARNRAINSQRRKRPQFVAYEEELAMASDNIGLEEAVDKSYRQAALRRAIHTLPESQREVLNLVFFHQLSGVETASVLNISVGTVKSRLHRAKETLRRLLPSEELL